MRKDVDDLGGLADAWRRFGQDADKVIAQAMQDAFVVSGLIEDIWNRTPKSLWQRYAERYEGVTIKGVTKRGEVRMSKGWRDQLTDRQLAKVEQYGHENLARSLLPAGPDWRSLTLRQDHGRASVHIASSLPYARRMHEAKRPKEGHYWSPGETRGWSARLSGNKFLEGPFEDNSERVYKEFSYQLDRQMRSRGLVR